METKIRARGRRAHGHRPGLPESISASSDGASQSFPDPPPAVLTFRYRSRLVVCDAQWGAAGALRSIAFECSSCGTPHVVCLHEASDTVDAATGRLSIPGCVRCAHPCRLHLHVDDGVTTEFPSIFVCARDGAPR